MSNHIKLRRNRASQNVDKQLLRKLYSQQSQLNKVSSLDQYQQKDMVIKDLTFVSTSNQNYKPDQIMRAYKFLCMNSSEGEQIDLTSLSGFLQEQSESRYAGVEMISFLDKEKKGFVSKEEFFAFFQKGTSGQQAQIPQNMKKDIQLVKSIDKHQQGLFKNFKDSQYCQYAAKQIKRFKYSQQL